MHNITIFFGVIECVGHSFAYVAHFVFLRDSNTESCSAVASRCATGNNTNLATHLAKNLLQVANTGIKI